MLHILFNLVGHESESSHIHQQADLLPRMRSRDLLFLFFTNGKCHVSGILLTRLAKSDYCDILKASSSTALSDSAVFVGSLPLPKICAYNSHFL